MPKSKNAHFLKNYYFLSEIHRESNSITITITILLLHFYFKLYLILHHIEGI
jgi:hypothetical protein